MSEMITKNDAINWLWSHLYYPAYEKDKRFWIGQVGPFRTKLDAVKAAIRLEREKMR